MSNWAESEEVYDMGLTLTQKILEAHDVSGKRIESYSPGDPIFVRVDECITQDATGTMAWLEFEAIGIREVQVPLAVSYIDHNTLQADFRNFDDHQFLRTIAARKGAILSRPGNGILHQVNLENFARPGMIFLGSDSHTPTGGGAGAMAIGVGGLVIATSMAGQPFEMKYPNVVKVRLTGRLRKPWVSAMDVILEILRRLGVKGGLKRIFEYGGPGIEDLSVPERATITNMGAELGATTSIFPSDDITRHFLAAQGREEDYLPLRADDDAEYDELIEIDLSELEPMVALPHSPGNVVRIRDLVERKPIDEIIKDMPDNVHEHIREHIGRLYDSGLSIDQACVGSCTNASYLALATASSVLSGQTVADHVSMTVSPGSKNVLAHIAKEGLLQDIIDAGARVLEATCGPCIGMGQCPPSNGISVRSFNRNFFGRSGEKSAGSYLLSAPSAALFAVRGKFVDPLKESAIRPRIFEEPDSFVTAKNMFIYPPEVKERGTIEVVKGPNIKECPVNDPLPQEIGGVALLKTGDDITTDDIMMAGAKVLPLRSNIPAIAEFVFNPVDETFVKRANELNPDHRRRVFFIVGGDNYGQGSSREHAAIAPMWLGLGAVVAKSIARIHRDNLIQWGMLPLEFVTPEDYEQIQEGDDLQLGGLENLTGGDNVLTLRNVTRNLEIQVRLAVSSKEIEMLKAGGALPFVKQLVSK